MKVREKGGLAEAGDVGSSIGFGCLRIYAATLSLLESRAR